MTNIHTITAAAAATTTHTIIIKQRSEKDKPVIVFLPFLRFLFHPLDISGRWSSSCFSLGRIKIKITNYDLVVSFSCKEKYYYYQRQSKGEREG